MRHRRTFESENKVKFADVKMRILNFLCGQHISNTIAFMHKKYQANPWRID